MADKNVVDLVIKARNEASKNLDVITESWKEFQASIKTGSTEAGKANDSLGQLGNALGSLMQQAKGLSALGAIAENLDRVDQAATESAKALNKSAQETKDWSALQAEAAASAKKFRDEVQAQSDVLNRAKATRDAYKKDLAEVNKLVKETERAQNAYNKELARTPRKAPGPVAPTGDTSVFRDAQSARGLQAQVQQQLADQNRTIAATEAELARLNPKLDAAAKYEKDLGRETAKATAEMKRNEAALATVTAEQSKVKAVADQASAAMGGLALRQNEVAAAAAKNATEIDRTRRAIEALNKFSSGGAEVVDPKQAVALQKQIAAINTLRDDWKALEGEAKRLSTGLQTVSGNATAQVDAFKRITDAARKAKTEYFSQVDALDKLRAAAGLPVSGLNRVAQAATSGAAANRQLGNSANAALPPIRALGSAAQSAGSGMQSGANSANSLDNALKNSSRGGREALSLFQRIRGEVLSLAAAYIGLNAAISQIGGVLKAFQTLEAAQSRLGVVFNQDTGKVSQELAFLERNAARLGIEFGVLSDQYSKFAIAANSANFTAQATRDVFLSVAEAGRVNKLSIDQLNGVFLALEQMISKGKVSSEELRRQLGDRLAGAFNIFADAIGVSAAELDDMMKKGEVLADQSTLVKFADELKRRFGPQLGAALASTTAELGRFQNNLFQAQLRIGEGGFIDAFTEGLRTLNTYFQSTEGREFFLSLGTALGNVTRGLIALLPYMDDFARIAGVLVALKVAGSLGNWLSSIKANAVATGALNREMFTWAGTVTATQAKWNAFAGTLTRGTGIMADLNAQLRVATVVGGTAGARFLAMQAALTGLTRLAGVAAGAFRFLWSAIGGLPGIILTGVTLAVTSWMTEVDNTTSALDRHKVVLETVLTKYDEIKGKVTDTKTALQDMSRIQIDKNVLDLRESIRTVQQEIDGMRPGGWFYTAPTNQRGVLASITALKDAYKEGSITATQFKDGLNGLYASITDAPIKQYAASLEDSADKAIALETALSQASLIARETGSNLEGLGDDAAKAGETIADLDRTVTETGESLEKAAEEKAKKFNEAMAAMGELIPGVANELKRLETIKGLEEQFNQAIKLARTFDDLVAAQDRYNSALSNVNQNYVSSMSGNLADRIVGVESGGNANAKNPNSSATGLGQFIESTWLRMFKQYFPDRASGLSDQMILELRKNAAISRDMVGLYMQENAKIFQQAGVAITDANLYLAHFLGPGGATKLLKAPTGTPVADVLGQDQIQANQSILGGGKTVEEIVAWAQRKVGISREELSVQQELAAEERKRLEEQEKQQGSTSETIAGNDQQIRQQQLINDGKGRQAAIEAAIAEAKKENPNITPEELERITQQTAQLYDQKNAVDQKAAAEERVNQLYQLRQQLLEQMQMAQENGDLGQVSSLQTRIGEVNGQLQGAIQSAVQMWQTIGGPEADAAIAKLQTMGLTIQNATNNMGAFGFTAQQTQQLVGSFVDGLVGVFDSFAQAVANGENAFQALGTAFLQFAANFLREIAMMILKQTILNALAGFGGPIGKAASALGGAVAHDGGTIGSTSRSRSISPNVFAAASYYHTGGVAGLRSNEVPAILERGETIRTEAQESALTERMNAAESAKSAGGGINAIRNVITLDPGFAESMINSSTGEQAIMSVLGRNKGKLRSLVG